MTARIAFIGLGEAGSAFAAALRARGARVAAFDLLPQRVAAAGFPCLPLPELAATADLVLSTVTTTSALDAARDCLPHLRPRHLYIDLNSTSPAVKREIETLLRPSRARFAEGAILGAVGVSGAATRILTGGPAGPEAAATLSALGLHADFFSHETGKASSFKMLRGVFSKGLEALLVEFLVAARRAGLEKELWADIAGFMSAHPFEAIAENWLRTHAPACDRRYHEIAQIAGTVRELGLDPLMTAAAQALFARSRALGLPAAFPSKPASVDEVIDFIERRLRESA